MTDTLRREQARPTEIFGSDPAEQPARLSILLVEDEGITGQDIKECLFGLGYEVVGWASRGEEAVAMAQELAPDLILMDVGLQGDMDGIEAAQIIHDKRHVPIIFLTGFRDAGTLHRAVLTGPHGYLLKPFHDVELRGAIEVAVYKHRAEVAVREREAALRKNAQILESLSLVDDLTGLRNRRGFFTLAQQEIKLARRSHIPLALFFADLNGLKQINDTFGHASGDTALCDTAEVLRQTFREADVVARLGGDEFVALANVNGESAIEIVKQRLADALAQFNASGVRPYKLALSVGAVASSANNEEDIDALLARADRLMYHHKRARSGEHQPG